MKTIIQLIKYHSEILKTTGIPSHTWHWVAIFKIEALAWAPWWLLPPCTPKTCLYNHQILEIMLFSWLTNSTIGVSCQHEPEPLLLASPQNNWWSHCRILHDQILHWPSTSCWCWMQWNTTIPPVPHKSVAKTTMKTILHTCTATYAIECGVTDCRPLRAATLEWVAGWTTLQCLEGEGSSERSTSSMIDKGDMKRYLNAWR